jgi:hypothetical protein
MARKTKADRIAEIDLEIEQLTNQRKQLEAQERERARKERTSRLCERGGFIESVMPETVKLDKTQFQDFIKRTLLTDYARRELAKLRPIETKEPAAEPTETPQTVTTPTPASTGTPNAQSPKQA